MTDEVKVEQERRHALSHHEQMLDAQNGCVPCKLCGGKAVISDAGTGAGYYIHCGNSVSFRDSSGCIIGHRRLGGWAYNVMDWWNRLHSDAARPAPAEDAVERVVEGIIAALRAEQTRCDALDHILDTAECIAVIQEWAALAAMQPRGEQQEWPADAAFPLGALVQKKGRASWRGKIVGWYRTDITALGYAVESTFEPGSVQIYPETALVAWDGEQQAGHNKALFNALMASSEHVADPIPLPQPSEQATRLAHAATPETFPKDSCGLAMWLDRALQAGREEGR